MNKRAKREIQTFAADFRKRDEEAQDYHSQAEAFRKDWQSAIEAAYNRMARGDCNAFYLYFLPNGEKFATFSEMDTIPQGFQLVTGERISGFKTLEQLYAWANVVVGFVPYYKV